MRFIARSRAHQHWAQQEKVKILNADGDKELIQRALLAQFRTAAGLTPFEKEEAVRQLVFPGRTLEEDEMTLTPIDERLGVFDSLETQRESGWTDKEREIVEQSLLSNGDNGFEYVVVVTPARPAPWPRYDSQVPAKGKSLVQTLADKVREDGHDVEEAIAYERENKNRPAVIEAYGILTSEAVVEEQVEVTA